MTIQELKQAIAMLSDDAPVVFHSYNPVLNEHTTGQIDSQQSKVELGDKARLVLELGPTPFEQKALSDIYHEYDFAHRMVNGGFSKNEAWELVKLIRDKPTPLGGCS